MEIQCPMVNTPLNELSCNSISMPHLPASEYISNKQQLYQHPLYLRVYKSWNRCWIRNCRVAVHPKLNLGNERRSSSDNKLADDCPVCKHPQHELYEQMFLMGNLSLPDAAERLGVEISEFWHHVRSHLDEEEKEIAFDRETRINMLDQCLYNVYRKAKELFYMPNDERTIKTLTSLVTQVRGLARDVGVLEGDVSLAPQITLQQINLKLSKFQSWLSANLCNDCKRQFVEHLETIANVVEP